MITKHWEPQDIDVVAEAMIELRKLTFFNTLDDIVVTKEEMAKWLLQVFTDPKSTAILALDEQSLEVKAVAGVTYGGLVYPPHLTSMYEWLLYGEDAKSTAVVWSEAKKWAKQRGVLLAKRSILQEDVSRESIKWEKL